jgi:tRNA(His) 5'-end guanylyltransferase
MSLQKKLIDDLIEYEERAQTKLMRKTPVIIKITGRNFAKITKDFEKPYSAELAMCFLDTMHKLCIEIEGTVFGYYAGDSIFLVCRNDLGASTTPWYDNDVQKIASCAASIATGAFYKSITTVNDSLFDSDIVFLASVFPVPYIEEAYNYIIYRQYENIKVAAYEACFAELFRMGYNPTDIDNKLYFMNYDDKVSYLRDKLGIKFNDYPIVFRHGAACYRVNKIIGDKKKSKWTLNKDIPNYATSGDELDTILNSKQLED